MSVAAVPHSASGRRDVLNSVLRELVSLDERPDGAYVGTPLLYPSGASVVVRVAGGPDRYLVSDFGSGFQEADMIGATTQFARHARGVAADAGVGFDEHAFFVIEIAKDQLAGAVVAIANCSLQAVSIAAYKLAEKSKSDAAELLYQRLIRVFPPVAVDRDVELRGSSNHPWHFATTVSLEGVRRAIFEPVAPVHVSVVTAAAKFQDIAGLDRPPSRNVVVVEKEGFGTWLTLLSQAANVIERRAPDAKFRQLATAA